MNQAIQFPDRESWDAERQGVVFSRTGEWDAINLRNFRANLAAAFRRRGASAVAGRLPRNIVGI